MPSLLLISELSFFNSYNSCSSCKRALFSSCNSDSSLEITVFEVIADYPSDLKADILLALEIYDLASSQLLRSTFTSSSLYGPSSYSSGLGLNPSPSLFSKLPLDSKITFDMQKLANLFKVSLTHVLNNFKNFLFVQN